MRRAALLVLVGCAGSGSQLRTAQLDTWPQGWEACSSDESLRERDERPVRAEDACGLGAAACDALNPLLRGCAATATENGSQIIVLVSTGADGKLSQRCLAASNLENPQRAMACIGQQLDAVTLPPSLQRAPVRIDLARIGERYVSMGTGLAQHGVLETMRTGAINGIKRCVEGQSMQQPQHGKLVMKWGIAIDGTVKDVEVVSKELEGTYIARCTAEVLSGLKFPAHTSEGEPVVMPFKF